MKTTWLVSDTTNLANTSSATAAEKHIILPVVVSCAVLTVILGKLYPIMKQQVDRICQTAYLEIRRIRSVCQFLTIEATKILVTSLVLSCLDDCNSLLASIPQKLVNKVQRVMNCTAHLVCKAPKREHVTFLLVDLHWLPVERRIEDCYDLLQRDHGHCSSLSVRPPRAKHPITHSPLLC